MEKCVSTFSSVFRECEYMYLYDYRECVCLCVYLCVHACEQEYKNVSFWYMCMYIYINTNGNKNNTLKYNAEFDLSTICWWGLYIVDTLMFSESINICIYSTPPLQTGCNTRSNFKHL